MGTERHIQARIDERERIGCELHDSVSQSLAGAMLLSRMLERKLRSTAGEDADTAAGIAECIDSALSRLRCMARGLAAVELTASRLRQSIRHLCDEARRHFGVRCRFRCEGDLAGLDDGAATHLYCLVNEALGNAVRHGRATDVSIRLVARAESGVLTVADNGNGVGPRNGRDRGIGLKIMRHRARQLGGTLTLTKTSGGGMTVTISF